MALPFWLKHSTIPAVPNLRPPHGVSAEQMNLHRLTFLENPGIDKDTILFLVPANPWEKQVYGISIDRSGVLKNVKVPNE